MAAKKLINAPENCVDESLEGFCLSHPGFTFFAEERIVCNPSRRENQEVAILSGGGSGHEPFPTGFIGDGMLTASVSGSVFAAPPKRNILRALRYLSKEYKGILLVVLNYTGDVLNFGLAIQEARNEGIQVESVIVAEDVALKAYGMESKSGSRGMCGVVLLLKIIGYLAKSGEHISAIKSIAELVCKNMASMGLSLEACSVPGTGLLFHLEPDEMELGVGVHGEAGVRRLKLKSAADSVKILLDALLNQLRVKEGSEVVVLINNLGAVSQLEQWIVASEVHKQLSKKGLRISRMYAGAFFTSLNMTGIQVCLLKLIAEKADLFVKALDEETSAPAWMGNKYSTPGVLGKMEVLDKETSFGKKLVCRSLNERQVQVVRNCLKEAALAMLDEEEAINRLDSECGDGDCGTTLARLAKEILKGHLEYSDPNYMFWELSEMAERSMGGTSGAIYGLFFIGASTEMSDPSPEGWAKAWAAGIECIKKYSCARIGDRTLMDSLEPSGTTFQANLKFGWKEALRSAVNSAMEGCAQTEFLKARIGRASYADKATIRGVDAGAYGVTVWLRAFLQTLERTAAL